MRVRSARSSPWRGIYGPGQTLLKLALREGSADLIAELTTGSKTFGTGVAERTLYGRGVQAEAPTMPHIAKLSKRFYDRLGEDIANELVDMYNAIDLTYKDELRELNDRNRSLVEARLDQRFAEFRTDMDRRFAEVHAEMDRRFTEVHAEMDRRFAELRSEMDRRFAEVDARFSSLSADFDAKLSAMEARLSKQIADGLNLHMRWMFVSWTALLIAYIGLR